MNCSVVLFLSIRPYRKHRFDTNKVLSPFYGINSYKNLFINAFILLKKVHSYGWKKCTHTLEKSAQVKLEVKRKIVRTHKFYNLDVIISVGYRVKSNRGISFRKWVNNVLNNIYWKAMLLMVTEWLFQKIRSSNYKTTLEGLKTKDASYKR